MRNVKNQHFYLFRQLLFNWCSKLVILSGAHTHMYALCSATLEKTEGRGKLHSKQFHGLQMILDKILGKQKFFFV